MDYFKTILFIFLTVNVVMCDKYSLPFVINTWAFTNATTQAWNVVQIENETALNAVEKGCTQCEIDQCDNTVGYGGSPDENGETTLDAMIMDGTTHNVGAIAALRRVKSAISVARKVLENTEHSLLVGDQATEFALKMGFKEETLSTPFSLGLWKKWKNNHCQPNFWKNVKPDPSKNCGPYKTNVQEYAAKEHKFGLHNHDTIGMIVIDVNGQIAAGTSSNGAKFKIPGRVGDSPIPGSGAYVDGEIGGAAATGDGDVMMRFLPSYNTVENMRRGMSPTDSARDSIKRIISKYPTFSGAIVATTIQGDYGAACHGIQKFPFSIANKRNGGVIVETIDCI